MNRANLTVPTVAACSQAIDAQQPYLVLIPAGAFRGVDGRPTQCDAWVMTADNAARIIAEFNAVSADMLIDYEHQSLSTFTNGQPAPAAGWIKALDWIDGVGVVATQWQWVDPATSFIESGAYRYLSPVFLHDPSTGDITTLLNVALVNAPNIDILPEVLLAAASRYMTAANSAALTTAPLEDTTVDELLKRLRYWLNLPTLATPEEVRAELEKALAQLSASAGVATAANATATLRDALNAVDTKLELAANAQAALSATAGEPDPTQYVPIAMYRELQHEMAAQGDTQIEDLIAAACSDGRFIRPSQSDHARLIAKNGIAALEQFIADTPVNHALVANQTQTLAANAKQQGATAFSDETLAVAKMFGNTVEQLTKFGG